MVIFTIWRETQHLWALVTMCWPRGMKSPASPSTGSQPSWSHYLARNTCSSTDSVWSSRRKYKSCTPWSRFSTLQKYTKESQTGLEETVLYPCSEKYYSRESSGGGHMWVEWVVVEAWYTLSTDQLRGQKAKWSKSEKRRCVLFHLEPVIDPQRLGVKGWCKALRKQNEELLDREVFRFWEMKGSGCISGWCHIHSNVTVPNDIVIKWKIVDMENLIVYMFYCFFLSTRRKMNCITEVSLQLISSPAQAGPILASSMECDVWLDPSDHGGTWVLGRERQSIEKCCRHRQGSRPCTDRAKRSFSRQIFHMWLEHTAQSCPQITFGWLSWKVLRCLLYLPGIAWQSAPRNSKGRDTICLQFCGDGAGSGRPWPILLWLDVMED